MRVLVLGSGAREHALVARLLADRDASDIVCAPGNPGIAAICRTVAADLTDPDGLLELATRERADLTVVGPELPLSLGVADRFIGCGAPAVRSEPARGAARVEQGVRQGVHGEARCADGPLPDLRLGR